MKREIACIPFPASARLDTLRAIARNAMFAILPLTLGCGFSLNPGSGAVSNSTAGGTGGSGPIGLPAPVPASLQPLTGCSNPNTGTSNGDWGVGSNPVYDNAWLIAVGTPVYSTNAVFWVSRETSPGQSILLSGAFTDAIKHARLAYIPPGTLDWQTLVRNSATVVSTMQQGTTGLSFLVPVGFPAGVYGFSIEDPSAPPVLGLANVPAMNWAMGVPSITDPKQALQHQIYDCGAEPGGILRISGKNFVPSNQVILQSSSGLAYSLTPSQMDSNSISVVVPVTLPLGTYTAWVGNLPWSVTSSAAAPIRIQSAVPLSVRNVNCTTLVGDGIADDTKHLQSCLDWYAPIPGTTELAYIAIPSGNFLLTGTVTAHPFEVLVGVSASSSSFIGKPRGAPPSTWFNVPDYFGMVNLSLTAPANPGLLLAAGTTTGNPNTSGHFFFSGIHIASTTDATGGAESMFTLAGPDIQVYQSSFLSNSNQTFDILYGDGALVSGNTFTLNNWTGLAFDDSQNLIFEHNLMTSQNVPGQGYQGHSGGAGLAIGRGNNQFGQSALSRDISVVYNTFQNMGSNDQQVLTNDGDGGSYFGPIAASTASTVTLAADPAWNWMGTTNPQAAEIAIIAGTGVGQYSFLQSYSGRTINLMTPWQVPPDGTSTVVITQYELYMTYAHNTFTNTLGASIVLADALEGVVEDNNLTNSGMGILISAFGPYGGPAAFGPVMNTDVLRNRIAVGAGNFIWNSVDTNIAGIGIQDFPGCLESGLLVRGNVVTSLNRIYGTDGVNGVSANLIEQNQAIWQPTFPTVGFVIQDNSTQSP